MNSRPRPMPKRFRSTAPLDAPPGIPARAAHEPHPAGSGGFSPTWGRDGTPLHRRVGLLPGRYEPFPAPNPRHTHCTRRLAEAFMRNMQRTLNRVVQEELRAGLRDARSRLLRTAATTEEELAALEAREPGAPIEGAARQEVVGVLARLDARERSEIEEIDAALVRLRAGTYGACEGCGGSIPLPRLRAIPATRHCLTCQVIRE